MGYIHAPRKRGWSERPIWLMQHSRRANFHICKKLRPTWTGGIWLGENLTPINLSLLLHRYHHWSPRHQASWLSPCSQSVWVVSPLTKSSRSYDHHQPQHHCEHTLYLQCKTERPVTTWHFLTKMKIVLPNALQHCQLLSCMCALYAPPQSSLVQNTPILNINLFCTLLHSWILILVLDNSLFPNRKTFCQIRVAVFKD